MASTSVDYDHFESLFLELCDTLSGDGYRIRLGVGPIEVDLCLCRGLSRLIESASTKGVCADDAALETTFLIVDGQFGTRSSLAVTLEQRVRATLNG